MNLQMELTSFCNLSCVECPHRFMKREQSHMDRKTFEAIINKIIIPLNPETIILHKDGEPLLHPKFEEFVEDICDVSFAKIDIYTNGILLNPKLIKHLSKFQNRIWILISFHFFMADGSKVEYDNNHIMNCIEQAGDNVEFVMASHLNDLVERSFLEEWQNYWISKMENYSHLKAVHLNTAINPWTGLIKQRNTIRFTGCPYADGEHLFIGAEGNVLACCMDLEEEISFGNIKREEFGEVMALRQGFYKNIQKFGSHASLCRRCTSDG